MATEKLSLWNPAILQQAFVGAFTKLNPRLMVKNPVMFVVEVGSVLTSALFVQDLLQHKPGISFNLQITLWLWFTVLFANFAEAMAEGRGKAQADTLRKAKGETMAYRYRSDGTTEEVSSSQLRTGDVIRVEAGQFIAGDGEVIEGVASVDESAITGESAPVIREAGGDRSAVTGGTRVLSDWVKIKITSNPGETFLDRMIALVEGAERQKTPNEIALSILLSGLTIVFLLAVATLQPFAIYSHAPQTVFVLVSLLVCLIPTTIGGLLSAIGIAGMDRLVQYNVLAMSGRAVEAAGDVEHASPRQDRNHHPRQSPGNGVLPRSRDQHRTPRRCRAACVLLRRNAGGPFDRRPCQREIQPARTGSDRNARRVRTVYSADPHVGNRSSRHPDTQRLGRCDRQVSRIARLLDAAESHGQS